jgi:hypothetical protein
MGLLMLRCPTTGRGFATGVNTDEATFKRLPDTISTARCPHCGQEHPWRPSDARLLDIVPPSLWAENASKVGPKAVPARFESEGFPDG